MTSNKASGEGDDRTSEGAMRSPADTHAAPVRLGAFAKFPRELRDTIYEAAFDPDGEGIEILGPRPAGLQSLLQVNNVIGAKVQQALQRCLERQTLFKATCHTSEDVRKVAERTRAILDSDAPPTRRVNFTSISLSAIVGLHAFYPNTQRQYCWNDPNRMALRVSMSPMTAKATATARIHLRP